MKLTLLGTGTSQGVPIIGCRCPVCLSEDRRDRRLRTSAMVECGQVRLIIDVGPDFRYQALRAGFRHINGVLLTHEHKDHIGGLDDLRALNFVDYPTAIHCIPIYATARTMETVRKDYDYAFAINKYRGVPEMELHEIDLEPFTVDGVEIIPIKGHHSSRFEVRGYRIGAMAYLTDFKSIDESEIEKLLGLKVLVVNALRPEPHYSHFSIPEALSLIERVRPERALLTHASHDIGLHAELDLPEGVEYGYDMLSVEIND